MPSGNCLHEIFAARAREAPGRIAVSAGDRRIDYGGLDAAAERLARRLRGRGVGPETLVGLCAERGVEMIVGLLGILKAGGAYLPIDPAYPAPRIALLLADSAASLVVATRGAAACLEGSGAAVVLVDAEPGETGEAAGAEAAAAPGAGATAEAGAENLAYVIYTSGSTGVPKGVLVEHRNVVRLFDATRPDFRFDERDVWTLFHSISFDFSVWEVWGALLHGGRLVIVPSEVTRSPERLRSLLAAEGVTILSQTPSAFRQLMAASAAGPADAAGANGGTAAPAGLLPGTLRAVVFGGEALDVELLAPWIARHGDQRPALVNMYGITETTVHVTSRRIAAADLRRPGVSPIGAPLADLAVRLLDAGGEEVPEGAPGEIAVAGAGLARGYLNRPGLTAERFVPAPGGQRLYRSGDLASRQGGELVYLGRLDDQMKVRGFRIEPREIEACLAGHPDVAAAVVVQQDFGGGDARLAAFVLPRRQLAPGEAEELTAALAARAAAELPAHLRPAAHHVLAELPLTAQGKVDRQALRQRGGERPPLLEATPEVAAEPAPPPTFEQAILAIVEDALGRRGVGVHDDLFDIGGTSMTLIRVLRSINQRFDVALNGSELGDEATVARLARCVEAMRRPNPIGIPEARHAGHPSAP